MANVRVNWGQWIWDCSEPHCNNAEGMTPGQAEVVCSNCGRIASVVWPAGVFEIERVLALRPVPQTRNWYPGETVADLNRENAEHGVDIT